MKEASTASIQQSRNNFNNFKKIPSISVLEQFPLLEKGKGNWWHGLSAEGCDPAIQSVI